MEVLYKTIVHKDYDDQDYERYELLSPPKACCDRMGKAWWAEAVVFGHEDYGPNQSEVQITRRSYVHDTMETETFPISFCPFCGTKIECVEAARVRRIEEKEEFTVRQTKVTYREEPA